MKKKPFYLFHVTKDHFEFSSIMSSEGVDIAVYLIRAEFIANYLVLL